MLKRMLTLGRIQHEANLFIKYNPDPEIIINIDLNNDDTTYLKDRNIMYIVI